MHSDTVFTKTAKGVLETRDKQARLAREARLVFTLIDGKATVGDLEAKCSVAPTKLREALEQLAAEGYIKDVDGSAPAASPKGVGDDLDFTQVFESKPLSLQERLKKEAEARAQALAAMRADAPAAARFDPASTAQGEDDSPSIDSAAEIEARLRLASAAIARAQAETRSRNAANGRTVERVEPTLHAPPASAAEEPLPPLSEIADAAPEPAPPPAAAIDAAPPKQILELDLERSPQRVEPRGISAVTGAEQASPGLLRAVENAAALVKADAVDLTAESLPPSEDRDREDKLARYDRIAEQNAARARERATAVEKTRSADRARRQEEEARRVATAEKQRRHRSFIRGSAATLVVLLAATGAILQFVSIKPLFPDVERQISARLNQPVTIASLRYPLFPKPRLLLEHVAIASGGIKADELSVPGLPFTGPEYARVEGRGIVIDASALPAIATWATTPSPGGLRIRRLSLENMKINSLPVDVGSFHSEVELSGNGTVTTAVLKNANAALTLRPLPQQLQFSLTAEDWKPPLGPQVQFTYLDLSGIADRTHLGIRQLQGRVAGGNVSGTMLVRFGSAIAAEGTFGTEYVRLQDVMPAFTTTLPVSGLLTSKGRYALQANKIEALFSAPAVDATFTVTRGEFQSIDIVRTVQATTRTFRGGRTPFDDLSGSLRVANGRYTYRSLSLSSGALTASGAADITANGDLAGQFSAEVGAKGRVVARSSAVLAGTLKEPQIRY